MTVTVIALSDSHAAGLGELPQSLRDAVRTADVIVHAGDHTEMSLLQELRQLGQVVAVAGNMDSTALKVHLPHRQLITINGRLVGVVHGSGAPGGITERVRAQFPENPDLIIFGHSHVPFSGKVNGTLMVNPGPATQSYARIHIGETIDAELVSVRPGGCG